MRVVLLAFLVVAAGPAVVVTSIWAAAASFGLLQSTIVTLRGSGYRITIPQLSTGTTTIRDTDLLYVV